MHLININKTIKYMFACSYKNSKYDSLSGAGAIIDYDTGEVLHMPVRNKYCSNVKLTLEMAKN